MTILKPNVNKQEKDLKSHDYETINFTLDFDKLPPEGKIEWRSQIGNIVARYPIQTSINLKRLKIKMRRLENEVQIKKATNKAHLVSINDLEQKLISLGTTIENRSNISSMIKEKDKEIQNLRGKLSLRTIVHNQTKEIVELEKGKDQFKDQIRIILEQNEKQNENIDKINEEKGTALSVKLAKKVTIPDVEEIPDGSDQEKIIQLKNQLSTTPQELQKGESIYQWKVSEIVELQA